MLTWDSPEERQNHKGYIDDIQAMRGIAILAVLFYHFSLLASLITKFNLPISNPLYSGVDLFFVISGFVVMRSLIRGKFDPLAFAIRRVFRLYPAIFVFLAMAFGVNILFRNVLHNDWAHNFFTAPLADFYQDALAVLGGYFINGSVKWVYSFGAIWSLAIEFQFYAAILALMLVFRSLRVRTANFEKLFLGLSAALLTYCLYARICILFRPQNFIESYLTNYRFDFMMMGTLLAFVSQEKLNRLATCTPDWAPMATLLSGWIVLMFFRTPEAARPDFDKLMSIGMILSGLAFTATVALCAGGYKNKALPKNLRAVLLHLGNRSYSIYLFHFALMALVWAIIFKFFTRWATSWIGYPLLQIVFSLLLILIASEFSGRFIEQPAIALSARLVKRLRRQ